MQRKNFCSLMFCLLLVFAAIASQGCVGSSNSPASTGGNSVVIGGDTILGRDTLDIDGNNKLDFLDFDGISAKHVKASSSPSSVDAQVPAVIFFDKLRDSYVEGADTVSVNLQAGTEYTFEFSRNFADPIESLLPVIEILDPSSQRITALSIPGVNSFPCVLDLHAVSNR